MFSLNHLPELALHYILKHAINDAPIYRRQLAYLAVCHSWRQIALPLVYKEVYFCAGLPPKPHKWDTNLGLFLSTGYFSFAKRLHVRYFIGHEHPEKKWEPFLNLLNMRPVQWPANHQQKLLSLDKKIAIQSLKMNKGLLPIIKKAVDKFSKRFPRMEDLKLTSSCWSGINQAINTLLVNTLAGRLCVLDAACLLGPNVTHSLDNLTSLTYTVDDGTHLFLSKVNILVLEKLHLTSVPSDFSWGFFEKNPSSSAPVVFSNLKDLTLDCAYYLHADDNHGEAVPDTLVGVQFPKLQKFVYRNTGADGFVFQPEFISSQLYKAELEVTGDVFIVFGKLPIESIGFLKVNFIDMPRSMSEFGILAKNMELDMINIRELIGILDRMPQTTCMSVETLECKDLEDLPGLCSSGSKLEELNILDVIADDIDSAIVHIVEILEPLTYLQRLGVGQTVAIAIEKEIGDTKEYLWLKDLEIKLIKNL